jgi:HSP20 family protein
MQLVKFDPLRDLQRMERDMEKLWENGWGMMPTFAEASAMDLYEEDGKLVAEVNLPNFKKDEVKVTFEEDTLAVSAEHQETKEDKGKRRYFFRESSNHYLRRVTLPQGVNTDKAEASFKDGNLKITMPMAAKKIGKTVAVK